MSTLKKVGALWSRVSKDGKTPYITGVIDRAEMPATEKVQVVVFKNERKKSEKHPDYIMYLSEQRKAAGQGDMFSGGQAAGDGFPDDDAPF